MQADVPAWAPEGLEGRSQEAIADQGRPWLIKAFWNPRCYQHLRCLYFFKSFSTQEAMVDFLFYFQEIWQNIVSFYLLKSCNIESAMSDGSRSWSTITSKLCSSSSCFACIESIIHQHHLWDSMRHQSCFCICFWVLNLHFELAFAFNQSQSSSSPTRAL